MSAPFQRLSFLLALGVVIHTNETAMKHTLNVLTLTALAAAASAQTAPASGLNYNTVSISRASNKQSLAVQGLLGSSNILLGYQSNNGDIFGGQGNFAPQRALNTLTAGYVFRGVTQGIDATVLVEQSQGMHTGYGVNLRRALNEVYAGLEISATYVGSLTSGYNSVFAVGGTVGTGTSATAFELSYNYSKTISFAVGLAKGNEDAKRSVVYSVRAAF